MESVGLQAGRAAATGNMAAQRAEGQVQKSDNVAQQAGSQGQMQQGMQMGMQMASQLGSTLGQLPQQASQMIMQPMQQLTQPLQQVTSMFSQMGGMGGDKAQMGLIGTSPLSNHPLAGGSGPGSGAGLVRAASLPGAGGTLARTPLMASLIGETSAGIGGSRRRCGRCQRWRSGAGRRGRWRRGSDGRDGPTRKERRFEAGTDGTERAAARPGRRRGRRLVIVRQQTSRPSGRKDSPVDGEDTAREKEYPAWQ